MHITFSEFQDALQQQLGQGFSQNVKAILAAEQMSEKLKYSSEISLHPARFNPITQVLSQLTHTINTLTPQRQLLANYVLQLADQLNWYQRVSDVDLQFNTGHANAQIIGPQGLYVNDQVMVGVSVMQPQLRYPDHDHPPEEIYLVLSDGQWWQQGEEWCTPGTHGFVYNPAGVLHAMRSLDQPLLALWCLNL